jgi:hypothetical protein
MARSGSGTVGKGSPVGVDFLSTTTGERAVSGISKAKERLDKRMLELLRAALTNTGEDAGQIAVGEWTLPHLRRTAATGMTKLQYRSARRRPHPRPASGLVAGVPDLMSRVR